MAVSLTMSLKQQLPPVPAELDPRRVLETMIIRKLRAAKAETDAAREALKRANFIAADYGK